MGRFRVSGLKADPSAPNGVRIENRVIAKVSRTELAEMFLRPPPQDLLKKALQEGWITQEQAQLSQRVPVADDISVESDSGGHTDNRAVHVVLPMIIRLRNRIQEQYDYAARPRVGAGGGMGCPQALAAAFA